MRRAVVLLSVVVFAGTSWFFLRTPHRESPPRHDEPTREASVAPELESPAAPAPAGVLIGRVTREGQSIAARVELFPDRDTFEAPGAPLLSIATAEDGTFEMRAPEPGRYGIVATTGDAERGRKSVSVEAPGQRLAVDVAIRPGRLTLHGRARHEDGRPFGGWLTAGSAMPVRAGPDGRFQFTNLPPGKVSLVALVPGRLRVWSPDVALPREEAYELVVDAEAETIAGRVLALPDRSPVPGARLEATSRFGGHYFRSTVETDADGRFVLTAGEGEVKLEMNTPGYTPVTRPVAAGTMDIEILVLPGSSLSGTVVSDLDGKPVPDLMVSATYGAYFQGERTETAKTNVDGHFSFTAVSAGRAELIARNERWVPARNAAGDRVGAAVRWLAPGVPSTVEFRVRPAARVVGRVLDESGGPVAGALVRATDSRRERTVSATDRSGAFSLVGLEPGEEITLSASAPGRARTTKVSVLPVAGEPVSVELHFSKPQWLDLTVLDDETGDPVKDAWGEAVGKRANGEWQSGWGWSANEKTGADGTVRLGPLPAGPIGVNVEHSDYVNLKGPLPVPPASARDLPLSMTVRLERGLTISGRVLEPDGSPATDAKVGLTYGSGTRCQVTDGTFLLRGVTPGGHSLRAFAYVRGRLLSGRVRADAGADDVVIRIVNEETVHDPGKVFLRLLDPTGKPVLWAMAECPGDLYEDWVRFTPPGEVRVDESLYRSPCGSHFHEHEVVLVISNARSASGELLGCVCSGPHSVEDVPVEVRLPAAKAITGRIVDEGGQPVSGLGVVAEIVPPAGGRGGTARDLPIVSRTRTDAEGRFRLGGLGPAEFRIRVRPNGRILPPEPVVTRAGRADVRIVVVKSVTATLTFLDDRGHPVAGVEATCEEQEAVSDRRGIATLRGLPPGGGLRLWVTPPSTRPELGDLSRKDWEPSDETIRLERRYSIAGVVRYPTGRPVADAAVWLVKEGPPRLFKSESTRSDGTFRFDDLPDGPVLLSVRFGGAGPAETGVLDIEVAAGAQDVVLTVRRLRDLEVRLYGWPGGSGWLHLRPDGTDEDRMVLVVAGGSYRIENVDPEAIYSLWITTNDGRHCGFRAGVAGDAGAVALTVTRAMSCSGRVLWPEGVAKPSSRIRIGIEGPGFRTEGWVNPDLTFEARCLPSGVWDVRIVARGLRGEVRLEAGETANIRLSKAE